MLSNRRGVRRKRSLDWQRKHLSGFSQEGAWPIRERKGAGFAAVRVETEPISNSESPPVRLACREWRGGATVSKRARSGRSDWCQRRSRMRAALGMGGAPAACAGGRRRCRSLNGHLYSGASLLPWAVVCWGKR